MNFASRDLTSDQRHRRQHIALRVMGLVFMAEGIAATSWLERLVRRTPMHAPTGGELGVAIIVIFAFCFGAALLVHGQALFDPDLSPRARDPQTHSFEGTSND